MKKIIKKDPVRAQRIALVILFIIFGFTSFLALLSFPVLGWLSLAFTCFSIYLFITSMKIIALKKAEREEEEYNRLKNLFSKLDESYNENDLLNPDNDFQALTDFELNGENDDKKEN